MRQQLGLSLLVVQGSQDKKYPSHFHKHFCQQNFYFMQLGFPLSDWQKVQYSTDLFSDTQNYLFTDKMAWLKDD